MRAITLSTTSRRRLCAIYECKAAKRHLSTLPYTVAERGGRISQITCWQDNRGEGGGEFSVLRESFMIESVWNPRRTLVAHCRERSSQVPHSRGPTSNFVGFYFFAAEKVVFGGPRGAPWRRIHADRSRSESVRGRRRTKKCIRRLQSQQAKHARHDAHLAEVVRSIGWPVRTDRPTSLL